jgi:regulator of protease activity HflC (stomatin/prohibitin superfamily)
MLNTLLVSECGELAAVVVVLLVTGIYRIGMAEAGVVKRLGRFHRVVSSGTHWRSPIDQVAGIVDLRATKMQLKMGARTKDGVIITIPIAIETRVNPEMVWEAWSQLPDPGAHVRAQAEQVVLERLRSLTLDELFASQTGIAGTLKRALDENLRPLGHAVVRVQVTGAVPNNLEDARQYTGRLVGPGGGDCVAEREPGRSRVA